MAKPEDREIVSEQAEMLFRRIHPTQIKDDRPSKTCFYPKPVDQGLVSVDRSSKTSAEGCYSAYARAKSLLANAGGIWGVTVEECGSEGLTCLTDDLGNDEPGGPNPAHSLIDMSKLSEAEVADKAAKLFAAAKLRGKLAPV